MLVLPECLHEGGQVLLGVCASQGEDHRLVGVGEETVHFRPDGRVGLGGHGGAWILIALGGQVSTGALAGCLDHHVAEVHSRGDDLRDEQVLHYSLREMWMASPGGHCFCCPTSWAKIDICCHP